MQEIMNSWSCNAISDSNDYRMIDFVDYFNRAEQNHYFFMIKNLIGQELEFNINPQTYKNIQSHLTSSTLYFDDENANSIDASDILQSRQMTIIDSVPGQGSEKFASVLLRDLLRQILNFKRNPPEGQDDIPILIIIDEVHQFYATESSREALASLTEICKIGRSKKIGIIFSSQLPSDIPKGLVDVVNTKIFFKTNSDNVKKYGYTAIETEMLKKGYALAEIHELSQAKLIKFPLSYAGVV